MKIQTKTVRSFLAGPTKTASAVLLYGPDQGLVEDRRRALITTVLGDALASDPFALQELSEAETKAEPSRLMEALGALSLLGDRRCILIRQATDKLTSIIEEALPHARSDAFLIVCGDDLSPKSSLRQCFEAAATAAALPCYREEGEDLARSIRERLAQHGLKMDPSALPALHAALGNDHGVTLQEIDKIALYANIGGTIDAAMIHQVITQNQDLALDDVAHAALGGDAPALHTALTGLWREGTSPVTVLRACLRYCERLYQLHGLLEADMSVDAAMKQLRPPVFFKDEPRVRQHVRRWSATGLIRAMERLNEAESRCKQSDLPGETFCAQTLLALAARSTAKAA